jgi:hypothetical protein
MSQAQGPGRTDIHGLKLGKDLVELAKKGHDLVSRLQQEKQKGLDERDIRGGAKQGALHLEARVGRNWSRHSCSQCPQAGRL